MAAILSRRTTQTCTDTHMDTWRSLRVTAGGGATADPHRPVAHGSVPHFQLFWDPHKSSLFMCVCCRRCCCELFTYRRHGPVHKLQHVALHLHPRASCLTLSCEKHNVLGAEAASPSCPSIQSPHSEPGTQKSTRFGINITWTGACDDASGGAGVGWFRGQADSLICSAWAYCQCTVWPGCSVNCSFNECRSLCDSGCCEEELEKRNASASRCWFFTPLWFPLPSTSHKYLVLPFQGQHVPQLWLSAPLLTLIIHFVCSDRLFLFFVPVVFLTILLYLKKEIFLSSSDDHRLICT